MVTVSRLTNPGAAMTATSSDSATAVVTLRGGVTVNLAVLLKLLEIEARGCRFEVLPDQRICVRPPGQLTVAEIEFLKEHRDEARRIVEYQADDSHLRTDN